MICKILESVFWFVVIALFFIVMLFFVLGYDKDKNSMWYREPILNEADLKLMAMITSLREELYDVKKLKENGHKNDVTNLMENDQNLVYQQGI